MFSVTFKSDFVHPVSLIIIKFDKLHAIRKLCESFESSLILDNV